MPLPEMKWRQIPGTEKFVTPEPLPTPYERELLTILIEECAEVAQRATKMLRFGVHEVQPGQPDDNAKRLSLEVGDLEAVKALCLAAGLIDNITISAQILRKMEKLSIYMQERPDDY
jgi:hypothetical protein